MKIWHIKRIFFIICIICIMSFTSCSNKNFSESINTKNEILKENAAELTTANKNAAYEAEKKDQHTTTGNITTTVQSTSNQKENQDVANQIIAHIEDWIQIDNEYSRRISYDPIEASMISLYPTETKRTYTMIVTYPLGTNTYAPIFKVNANSFVHVRTITDSDEYKNFAFGSVYSGTTALASAGIDINNPNDNIYKMCDLAYYKENDYFSTIELNVEDNITLSGDNKLLYNSLLNAINDLEYHEFSNGIISKLEYIEYHSFGKGDCKAIFHYVGTSVGYSISSNGYDKLTYNDEQILKNSSLKRINWNPAWTTEKKEYNLKYAINNS